MSVRIGRLITASTISALVILASPIMGQVRILLRSAFPTRFVTIVGAAVGGAILVQLVVAMISIRSRRPVRYAIIALALALGIGYSLITRSGVPDVDAVEHVHFVEYGVITMLFYGAWRENGDASTFLLPVLAGLLVGTLDEWVQWFVPVRVGEMRDVVLNLIAICCGLLVGGAILPPPAFSKKLRPESVMSVAITGTVAVLVIASFIHVVHLGYLVTAEHIGAFKSHYTDDQLEALARDRADRWRTNPPTAFRRFSQEDQYMDEGFWHIRRRNEHWTAGNVISAWDENLILERFFAPVLDAPSYAAPDGGRWPADQRADAARRVGENVAARSVPFVSDAQPYPILVWPKAVFWPIVGLVAAAGVAISVLSRRR